MKEMLVQIASVYGKRYDINDKKKFLNIFSEQIKRLGFNVSIDEGYTVIKKYSGIYGKPEESKAIFITGYDTPSVSLKPNHKYYPINISSSAKENMIETWIRGLIGIILLAILMLLLRVDILNNTVYIRYGLIALFIGLIVFLFRGISCKYNFNRNTSAVTLLYKMAEELKGDKRFSFVYCDETHSSVIGYKRISSVLGNDINNKDVIILDGIGSGEELFLVHKNTLDKEASKILSCLNDLNIKDISLDEAAFKNTTLNYFSKTFIITSGKLVDGEIVIEGDRRYESLGCNIDRLNILLKDLLKFIKDS